MKSIYEDVACVTYEQHQFLLSRSAVEINISSDRGELVSFEKGKSIACL